MFYAEKLIWGNMQIYLLTEAGLCPRPTSIMWSPFCDAQPTGQFKGVLSQNYHTVAVYSLRLVLGYLQVTLWADLFPPTLALKQGSIVLVTSLFLSGDTVGNLKEMISGTQAWSEQEKNSTDNVFED